MGVNGGETEYAATKKQIEGAQKAWMIFLPFWFLGSIASMSLSNGLSDSAVIASIFFAYLPMVFVPVWIWLAVRMSKFGFFGPAGLKCENCGAGAYQPGALFGRTWNDICPNCGDDNRVPLNRN